MTEEPDTSAAETVDAPDEAEPADQPATAPTDDDEGGEGNQGEGPAEGDE
ncbi:MAG: hypothetical protein QOE65_593 [Solirubrobacteraceae bacterium]|jgi:hypothetical protein|nr:hypothetical protein [Solirubrobacteraceae bacterium]